MTAHQPSTSPPQPAAALWVLIRTDASAAIGGGHVARCRALAQAFVSRGAQVVFACKAAAISGEDMIAALRSVGYRVAELPADSPVDCVATLKAALMQLAELAPLAVPPGQVFDWLIVDHYQLGADWERNARPLAKRLMALEDGYTREHHCDVLLNQNPGADAATSQPPGQPQHQMQLLGPQFALLAPAFAPLPAAAPLPRPIDLAVFFGLGPVEPALQLFVAAVALWTDTPPIIHCVAPLSRPSVAAIAAAAKLSAPQVVWLAPPINTAALYRSAKLGLGAGGVSLLERCAAGCPSVVLTLADNQVPGSEALAQQGACILLGDVAAVSPRTLASALHTLWASPPLAANVAVRGTTIVDGLGAPRVADRLLARHLKSESTSESTSESIITLARATPADSECLWHWRNAPLVREASLNTHEIGWQDHQAWFASALANPDRDVLVASLTTDHGAEPIGVVRFDWQALANGGSNQANQGSSGEVSIFLAPNAVGKGLGVHCLHALNAWLAIERPNVRRIQAIIKPGNGASQSAFERAGYQLTQTQWERRLSSP